MYCLGLPSGVEERDDGGIHPVNRAVLGAVADLAVPHLAIRDGVVHLLEKLLGVVARVEDAMVLAQQLIPRVLADGAELVVYIGDGSLHVSRGDNSVLVESVFLFAQRLLGVPRRSALSCAMASSSLRLPLGEVVATGMALPALPRRDALARFTGLMTPYRIAFVKRDRTRGERCRLGHSLFN